MTRILVRILQQKTLKERIICQYQPRLSISTSNLNLNLLNVDNINQNVRRLEYAVRGALVIRAKQLEVELNQGSEKPFKSIIRANIGDCQAMRQKPITFIRQVIACASDTSLLESSTIPNDIKDRVKKLLSYCDGGSVGAYSDSCGIEIIRRHVAEYIEQRDGGNIKVDHSNVFLCTGASEGIKSMLEFLNESSQVGKPVGIMIPIPQYPLYSATLCEYGIKQINYYLDEEADWRLDVNELERSYEANKDKANIRAIVVINPGNPTGSVLSEENILEILKFANKHRLVVMADEVYQHNIYDKGAKFMSFKKALTQKTNYDIELASFMSCSKGYMGECGLRGGYCELVNFSDDVRAILYKGKSSWLCSSTLGQICVDCVVKPPEPGQESYELYELEKNKVLGDLARKAQLVANTFGSMEGIKCNRVAGAMYAFPRLDLPPKAIEKANSLNYSPDFYYALEFLENYGVSVVPGSGFGQKPGTYHFRTTILPPPDIFEDMMDRFQSFHTQFINRFS